MLSLSDTPARRRTLNAALGALVVVFAAAALVAGTYRYSYRAGWTQLQADAQRRLEFLSNDLASALDKYDTLPAVLSSHPELAALLQDTSNPGRRMAVNHRLRQLAHDTRASAIYLMDAYGTTIASSNWNTSRSFVGQNYAFRPYYRQAIEGGIGRFYAVGATTGEPGYFLARAVRASQNTAPLGVVAVKISLDEIEANWAKSGERLMLADAHGVVFLASRPHWKFRSFDPLPPDVRDLIRAAQQYGDSALDALALNTTAQGLDGLVYLPEGPERGPALAAQRRPIGRMGWTLLSFSEAGEIDRLARGHAVAVGFACGFVLVGLLYAQLRRRRDEERRLARRELQRANAELEHRIEQRTAVLVEANRELASKIDELGRTQATLRATQNELVQAGKLAVLGQMAASITHEINQPLTALRALNDNAVMLLERDDGEAVRGNLQMIDGLAKRIGSIVSQLKGFARKDDLRQQPVALQPVVEAALSLVAADARRDSVHIEVQGFDTALAVQGQTVRIEQVLVNLLRNAIDASRHATDRQVDLRVEAQPDAVRLSIADHGTGIAPEARERLFEPFFTTKPAGQGLGLGLAISASIANALGGSLEAADRPGGGAVFTLQLRAARLPANALPTP